MAKWTEDQAPDQSGKIIVVTGANTGIGYEVSRMLCAKGATVVMACRSAERGGAALERLKAEVPGASAELMALDLADLESVRSFADAFGERFERLDGLLNNAGVMALPRQKTAQGFEMQFGVNHLGHFVLTARLIPRLAEAGRVVNVSSEVHRTARMNFDDLMGDRSYGRWNAYMQSKLANLLFTRQLQAELSKKDSGVTAYACHPGYAATELQGRSGRFVEDFFFKNITNRFVAQSAAMGALPSLRAMVDLSLPAGVYVGPKSMFGARGYPEVMSPSRAASSDADAARLWSMSVELTGERFF